MPVFHSHRAIARALYLSPLAVALALSGCGGGGGGGPTSGSGGSGTVATAPSFTSAGTVSVIENSADSFYQAKAKDPQNDAVTISVYSGADAGFFVIDGAGNLKFDTPPNYDLPGDADGNNIYEVVLRATAGGESADLSLRVTVTNDREGIAVKQFANGFVDPVAIAAIPNKPLLLVAEKGGRVLTVNTDTGAIAEDTFIRDHRLPGEILAVSYGFPGNVYQEGVYLITYSATEGLYLQAFNSTSGWINNLRLGDPAPGLVSASLIMSGSVFAAIGDPGGDLAHDAASPYGKLIELPFVDPYAGASLRTGEILMRPQVIGEGIQNPGGFSNEYGRLYLADQGSSVQHELTFFQTDWRPLDFGWPYYEGAQALRTSPPAAVNGPNIVYPVGNGAKEGTGVVGGLLNDYTFFPSLGDTYVFADRNGTIWSIPYSKLVDGTLRTAADLEVRTEDFAPESGKLDSPVAFAQGGGTDSFFILDADGELFKVQPSS